MTVRVGSRYQQLVPASVCQCCDPKLRDFTFRVNAELSRRGFLMESPQLPRAAVVLAPPASAKAEAFTLTIGVTLYPAI